MIKLDAKLINECPRFKNTIGYQELTLRNQDISSIETGLSSILTKEECIDFSNNCLIKLGNFPYMRRLKMLLLNNNCITEIDDNLQDSLPQLDTLVLTNNDVTNLHDIHSLSTIQTLRILSLIDNPITAEPEYRLYVIYHIPQLEVLDFRYVLDSERKFAASLYGLKEDEKKMPQSDAKDEETCALMDDSSSNL